MIKLLLLLVLLISSFQVEAQTKSIKVFEYPPYLYEEGGELKGMFFDIMKESFRLGGVKAKYSKVPVGRLYHEFQHGKNLIWLGLKEAYIESKIYKDLVVVDLIKAEIALFSDSKYTLNLNKDLKGKKVGVLRGFQDEIDALKKFGPEIVEVNSIEQMKELNKIKRIDYFSLEKLSLYAASRKDKEKFISNGTYLNQNVGVIFNKKNKKEITAFKKGLKKLKSSGEYKKIVLKYLDYIGYKQPQTILISK